MPPLFKVFLIIATCFASTFIIIKVSGVLTIEMIEQWLSNAQSSSPWVVAFIISSLLFVDLFIAMPTLTVIILAGFFLGFSGGFIAAFTGVLLAGMTGYLLSRLAGDRLLNVIIKDKHKQQQVKNSFHQHGVAMLLLSRALPILPETSACLAGMTKMSFRRFITCWLVSCVPYILIASYAGSISSLNNPKPAIYTVIILSSILWVSWWFYSKKSIQKS